jgi:hypothetical protein
MPDQPKDLSNEKTSTTGYEPAGLHARRSRGRFWAYRGHSCAKAARLLVTRNSTWLRDFFAVQYRHQWEIG